MHYFLQYFSDIKTQRKAHKKDWDGTYLCNKIKLTTSTYQPYISRCTDRIKANYKEVPGYVSHSHLLRIWAGQLMMTVY